MAYLDEPANGEVLEVKGRDILVYREDGFEEWMDSTQLIKRGDLNVKDVILKDQKKSRKGSSVKREKIDFIELDLHIHELLDDPRKLSNYQMLQLQLGEARKAIEKARRSFIKRVILIHGVGAGRLRSELHEMLQSMDRLSFHDADFTKYGAGATEVEIY